MALKDAVNGPVRFNDAGGGQRQAQLNNFQWTTPFVPFDTNLEGYSINWQVAPFQRGFPIDTTVSPEVEKALVETEKVGFGASPSPFTQNQKRIDAAGIGNPPTCPYADYSTEFWLDRLHILPVSAQTNQLGNLVNDVDTSFEVFNADRATNVTISVLDEDGTDGFTVITGLTSTPFIVPAYAGISYTIRAEAEFGPPTINATYTWIPSTSGFTSVSVNFTGQRITLFGFEPQQNPRRTMEFVTAIVESYNGTEQRMSMREHPYMDIEYKFVFGGDDDPYYRRAQVFEHQIFDSLGRAWLVPDWPDRTVLDSNVAVNDTVINITTANRNFEVGELLVLWKDWDDLEAQEISSVTASTVTVASPFLNAFTVAETVVLPSWIGYMRDNPQQTVYRVDAAAWTVNFRRATNITWDLTGSPEGTVPGNTEYLNIPLWPTRWEITGNSITQRWRRDIRFLDELGPLVNSFRLTTPKQNGRIVLEMRTRQEYIDLRSWLMYLRGRRGVFWLPTYQRNFNLTQPINGQDTTMRVTANSYQQYVYQREQFNHIIIKLVDGRSWIHEIINSADAGGGLLDLTFQPAFDTGESPDPGVTVAQVDSIEYISKHRLDTDKIVFQALPITDQWRVELPIVEVLGEV